MNEVKSEPFFTKLCEIDQEVSDIGKDVVHSVLYDTDATLGLSVDKHFVTIIRHDVGCKEVSGTIYMSVDVFEKLYKLYLVQKEVLGE